MRCKIMRIQKLMWRNIMKSTKSQKVSVLHYSIDDEKKKKNLRVMLMSALKTMVKEVFISSTL